MPPALSAEEIRDVNTRYHDVAAGHYDAKWGIDFGDIGCEQVLVKIDKAVGHRPDGWARSLEIGAGTGYFTLNLLRAGLIGEATCTDISPGMLAALRANVAALALSERALVLGCDALAALRREDKYDLVFLDPPYAMAVALAGALSRELPGALSAGARVVSESDRRAPLELELPLRRERRYGDTMIRIHEMSSQ